MFIDIPNNLSDWFRNNRQASKQTKAVSSQKEKEREGGKMLTTGEHGCRVYMGVHCAILRVFKYVTNIQKMKLKKL